MQPCQHWFIGRRLADDDGKMFGPAIGALASVAGRGVLFCVLAAITSLLLIPISKLPDEHVPSGQSVTHVLRLLRKPALAGAMWLMVLPARNTGSSSAVGVIAPVRPTVIRMPNTFVSACSAAYL